LLRCMSLLLADFVAEVGDDWSWRLAQNFLTACHFTP
jgi:hypothetical protein